jgi:hypothetical protein
MDQPNTNTKQYLQKYTDGGSDMPQLYFQEHYSLQWDHVSIAKQTTKIKRQDLCDRLTSHSESRGRDYWTHGPKNTHCRLRTDHIQNPKEWSNRRPNCPMAHQRSRTRPCQTLDGHNHTTTIISKLYLGGAMLNDQKIKSPPISIKFGDILDSAFDKT